LGYGDFIIKNDKKIILVSTILFLFTAIGLLFIKVDSNIIRYFDKKAEIRQASEFIMNNLTGSMSYTILIDSKKPDGIKDPAFLRTVEQFYNDFYKAFPQDVRHIFSLLDIIKRYNKVLNHQESIPDDKNLIAQYLLLYSMSLPEGMEISNRVDNMQQKINLTALVNIVDASKEIEMIRFIEKWWEKTSYRVVVTGQAALYAYMQKDVTNTLIYSFLLTIFIVSIIILLIFKKWKILWVLLLPNILPVVIVLGLMGWFGFTIDLGVAITGSIIIGVAIDDTIHFLVKYFDLKKEGLPLSQIFDEVLFYVGKAIIFTTLVLSGAFLMFIFSAFVPNQNFGIVTAVALLIALVVDLFFLPALLSVMDGNDRVLTTERKR
jgi:predicted RND superfamily exporter protein